MSFSNLRLCWMSTVDFFRKFGNGDTSIDRIVFQIIATVYGTISSHALNVCSLISSTINALSLGIRLERSLDVESTLPSNEPQTVNVILDTRLWRRKICRYTLELPGHATAEDVV